ncbi:glycosyl hydrolase family 61-domain-containing protein [Xylariaceae sp. FL0255]|nr:glycosyl hydrolase family 61-domain-containing protein [Xylariaceae sp. FL0255]
MLFKSTTLALGALAVSHVLAHGYIPGFVTDGVWNQGFLLEYYYVIAQGGTAPSIAAWYAEDLDSGFIAPDAYQTDNITCHKNAKPGALTATVEAGGTVEFEWTTWPHNTGPVLTYIAPCNGNCSAVNKDTLRWTKIDEAGYDVSTETWALQTLIDQNSTWTTTVPAVLAPGNYVFRHELIALQGGENVDGAQNYPLCFNIAVTGSGTETPPTGVLATDLYTEDDPGILFNPYTAITSYPIPGPTLWTGNSGSGASSSSTSKASTSTATSKASTTTRATTTTLATTKTATTATASPTATGTGTGTSTGQSLYGQCGGTGWTGPTTCASGTCTYENVYYSQCL